MAPLIGIGLELGKLIIDKAFPDKEKNAIERAAAELKLVELQASGELKQLETRMQAIIAEAQSSDPFTSRARPSFMYVFYLVIISLVIVAPIIGVANPDGMQAFFNNVKSGFDAIPEALWWTFTTGYLGYGGMRSLEKVKGVSK